MSRTNSGMKKLSASRKRSRTISTEGITFAVASLIVAVLVGLVLFSWFTQGDQPPVLAVQPSSEIRAVSGQFYVPFTVTNTGGATAESVQVIGELRLDDQTETGEQQIDFLSKGEQEEGAFVFSRDPRQGDLTIRVASYKLP
jgi:uncharacterized protein (TIGR02588 family)